MSDFIYFYAECRYAECRYAECRYAECRYAECRYAECHYTECHYIMLNVIMLSTLMLSTLTLSVIMLSVISPVEVAVSYKHTLGYNATPLFTTIVYDRKTFYSLGSKSLFVKHDFNSFQFHPKEPKSRDQHY